MSEFYQNGKECFTSDDVLKVLSKCETKLVQAASEGCLVQVKEIVKQVPIYDKAELINESEVWVEDLEAEKVWFSSTPLTAAAKDGHKDVVSFLLLEGADPTLESCPMPGVTETALSASQHSLNQLEITFRNIVKEDHYIYDQDAWKDTDEVILKHLEKYKNLVCCIQMLKEASRYWRKVAYSKAIFSKERMIANKVGARNPNKPRNKQKMCLKIQQISLKPDVSLEASFIRLTKHYNKLLLDKRCELLEYKIKTNAIKSKQNLITVLGHQEKENRPEGCARPQESKSLARIPKRYIGA